MEAGGVVRKIESWGTMQLPQRMKKKRTNAYEHVGEYVVYVYTHLTLFSCPVTVIGHSTATQVPKHSVH